MKFIQNELKKKFVANLGIKAYVNFVYFYLVFFTLFLTIFLKPEILTMQENQHLKSLTYSRYKTVLLILLHNAQATPLDYEVLCNGDLDPAQSAGAVIGTFARPTKDRI